MGTSNFLANFMRGGGARAGCEESSVEGWKALAESLKLDRVLKSLDLSCAQCVNVELSSDVCASRLQLRLRGGLENSGCKPCNQRCADEHQFFRCATLPPCSNFAWFKFGPVLAVLSSMPLYADK
eukprot:6210551-Pleurochrysis_carterae.AAC.4